MAPMKTVVLGPPPAEVQALIERRRALGIDLFDEVWEGSYHVVPAPNAAHAYVDHLLVLLLDPYAKAAGLVGSGPFNLGEPDDFRVPDHGYHRGVPTGTWLPTAAVVVEILSPDDETYAKFPFYARHGVEEILVVDPSARRVTVWARVSDERYEEVDASALLRVTATDLSGAISWPAAQ
jgi:Uma2 family endonuclease